MSSGFRPSVVVAQRGPKGARVYLTESGRWTPDLGEAELIEDEAHGDIRLLEAEIGGRDLTGVSLAEVRLGPAGPEALRGAPQHA
jgi:hypothetical protein